MDGVEVNLTSARALCMACGHSGTVARGAAGEAAGSSVEKQYKFGALVCGAPLAA
jgi:hypothetical protein